MLRRVECAALLLVTLLIGVPRMAAADDRPLLERAREAMRKGGEYWATKVASNGGYVWEYSTDFVTRRRGESGDLPLTTNWVQPPGTPSVGMAFVKAYEATGEKLHLDAALAAGRCLAWGQLASGGWDYSIEYDPKRNKDRYCHLEKDGSPGLEKLQNVSTFDDNNTQSATQFLMALDAYVDDPEIDGTIRLALVCFLTAQYKEGPWDGAWPQRFPYSAAKGYGGLPTYNDNTMSDCARTMLAAYKQYQKAEYLDSVKRCLEFYLRSQLPAPQSAWAQQYDKDLKPAWARKFEPPSVSGGESVGNMRLLMDMYVEFGDPRYLDSVGKAVEWFKGSRIGGDDKNGVWARFYEPGTNKPLYFTKTYKLVYTDDDLPIHYSFKGSFGVNKCMEQYGEMKKNGREYYLSRRDRKPTAEEWASKAKDLAKKAEGIIAAQDEQGRWVRIVPKAEQVRDKEGRVRIEVDENTKLPMMYSNEFIKNVRALAEYISAAQGGPKFAR